MRKRIKKNYKKQKRTKWEQNERMLRLWEGLYFKDNSDGAKGITKSKWNTCKSADNSIKKLRQDFQSKLSQRSKINQCGKKKNTDTRNLDLTPLFLFAFFQQVKL